jgi:hypothetical protein
MKSNPSAHIERDSIARLGRTAHLTQITSSDSLNFRKSANRLYLYPPSVRSSSRFSRLISTPCCATNPPLVVGECRADSGDSSMSHSKWSMSKILFPDPKSPRSCDPLAQRGIMKHAEFRNFSQTTLKPSKSPGFRPKITKMGRCDLAKSPSLKLIGLTSKNGPDLFRVVKQTTTGFKALRPPLRTKLPYQ